jgi:glycosyltransferase involved in cell wall biosynthesis
MTSYNREQFIAEAIESVLSSSFVDFEFIICDDASADNTVTIAKQYEEKDKRIKVYVNEKNLGDYPNRNKAASYAKGKYIKYCDSDDKLFDWTLGYCVEIMEKYPDAGMGILKLDKNVQEEYLTPNESIYKNFFENRVLNIGPSGTILKREAFESIGLFKTEYGVPSDMYFNLKMASAFPVVLLDKVFFFYRVHDGQEFKNKYSYVCYNYKYLYDAFQLPGFPLRAEQKNYLLKKAKKSFVREFFFYIRNTGNIKKAMKAIKISGIGFSGFARGMFQ